MTPTKTNVRDEILRKVAERGPDKSICPSEVARALAEDWQRHMTLVRTVACELVAEGRIDILRKGKPVPPDQVRGVIRLRIRSPDH